MVTHYSKVILKKVQNNVLHFTLFPNGSNYKAGRLSSSATDMLCNYRDKREKKTLFNIVSGMVCHICLTHYQVTASRKYCKGYLINTDLTMQAYSASMLKTAIKLSEIGGSHLKKKKLNSPLTLFLLTSAPFSSKY